MTPDIDDDDRVTASGSSNVEEEGEEKGKVFTEVSIQVLYCTVLYCTVLYTLYTLYCTVLSIQAGEPAIKMVRFSLEKENSSVRGSSYKSRLKSKVSRYICRYLVSSPSQGCSAQAQAFLQAPL